MGADEKEEQNEKEKHEDEDDKKEGIQQALSNAYLKAEGLFSLRQGWISLNHSV